MKRRFFLRIILLFILLLTSPFSNSKEIGVLTTPLDCEEIHFTNDNYSEIKKNIKRLYKEDIEVIEEVAKEMGSHAGFDDDNLDIGLYDLDDDGKDEIFVYFLHSSFCGTGGCHTEVYKVSDNQYISIFSAHAYDRVEVIKNQKTKGFKDIAVIGAEGSHIYEGKHIYKWNGNKYEYNYLINNGKIYG
jgi:hypothetical protein